jgi:hypothetical protein
MNADLAPVQTALQINMHPFDAPHVTHTLPHQIRVWENQVDRILLTVDTGQVNAGRYKGQGFDAAKARLFAFLESLRIKHPKLHIDTVDYGTEAHRKLGQLFFSRAPHYPDKAFDGGPFYVYFYGLMRANARYVLHMDSDMLFGGASPTWISEAIAQLETQPNALVVCPFSGPPKDGGDMSLSLHVGMPGVKHILRAEKLQLDSPAWRFPTVSTRIFMIDMQRFTDRIGSLDLLRPDLKRRIRSYAFNQKPISMPAEEALSTNMIARDLYRLDYMGTGQGMYSLHPPYRSPQFYAALPSLIKRIEAGDIPESQRGDFDINSSMLDWSSAIAAKSRSKRYLKALKHLISANIERFSRK